MSYRRNVLQMKNDFSIVLNYNPLIMRLSDSWSDDVSGSGSVVCMDLLELKALSAVCAAWRTWTLSYINWMLITAYFSYLYYY